MTYKRALVRDLQNIVGACLEDNGSRMCAERKQSEERASRRSLNEQSLEHLEHTE
jgi:hypothetical protein